MKIIPFKKKGRVYELLDEIDLNYDGKSEKNGKSRKKIKSIQVVGKKAVRVFITENNSGLTIEIPDVRTKFKVDPKKRELILFKETKVMEEM